MLIGSSPKPRTNSVRRSVLQVEPHPSRNGPLLRMEPEGFARLIYKHVTPTGKPGT